MFNSSYRVFIRRNFYGRVVSPILKPCLFQSRSFSPAASATLESISKTANENSFVVNYLINTLGYSPEKASSVSKHLKFESPEKPDSVVALLTNHGFTRDQIGMLVKYYPRVILCNPQKVLLPKIEFFQSMGFSDTEVIKFFLSSPSMCSRSLERQITPTFNYIKSLFDANGTCLGYLRSALHVMRCNFRSRLLPNFEVLKEAGVPVSKIVLLLQYFPRAVMQDTERFRIMVEDVKQIGINPSSSCFIAALQALVAFKKSSWEKRMAVYKKWGVSEHEILEAFRKHPQVMTNSIDKIMAAMDFFVNKMGFVSSHVLKAPALISYSLDKRIKPRSSVYNKLVDYGFIKKGTLKVSMYQCTESDFLKTYVQCYEEMALGLLEMYEKELAITTKKKHNICYIAMVTMKLSLNTYI